MKTRGANLTPEEIADLARERGARVVDDGIKYVIYPPDGGRPVFMSKAHLRGRAPLDKIADLRRHGVDVMAPVPAAPTCNTTTEEEMPSPMEMDNGIRASIGQLAERLDDMETTVKLLGEQGETLLAMMATADQRLSGLGDKVMAHTTAIDVLVGQLAGLDARVSAVVSTTSKAAKVPQVQVVRDMILTWFREHPDLRMSPAALAANLTDRLPQGLSASYIANACRDLVKTGELQGGGRPPKDGAKRTQGVASMFGVYWLSDAKPPQD